ncbi:hypothetical protein RFI_01548, partial [Reticulomyxa filosa]
NDDDNDDDDNDDNDDDDNDDDGDDEEMKAMKRKKERDLFLEIALRGQWDWKDLEYEGKEKKQLDKERGMYLQQVLEDLLMKRQFAAFREACEENPNLHRALVWIKAWWQRCHDANHDYGLNLTINTFHISLFLLHMHRCFHADIWDSPLIICAKWFELVSRQQLGSWLTTSSSSLSSSSSSLSSSSVSTKNDNDSNEPQVMVGTGLSIHTMKGRDPLMQSTNIWNDDNDDGEKKRRAQDDPEWKWQWLQQQMRHMYPVYLWDSQWKGIVNYSFRVSRFCYIHWVRQCEKASALLNDLVEQLPWMEHPDGWGYKRQLNPKDFDIVSAPLIAYHEKAMHNWLAGGKVSFWHAHDAWIEVQVPASQFTSNVFWFHSIEHILWQALQDRIVSLYLYLRNKSKSDTTTNASSSSSSSSSSNSSSDLVVIGLQLKPNHNDPLLIGPLSDTPAELTFRQFWGPHAVKKRFSDGVVNSAVIIPQNFISNGRSIEWMATYALQSHVADIGQVHCLIEPLLSCLPFQSNALLKKAFDQLESRLMALAKRRVIPLELSNISCCHPSLWGSHVMIDPILPHTDDLSFKYVSCTLEDNIQCIPVVIRFEPTSEWPLGHPKASKYLKMALYIRIRKALARDSIISLVATDSIDILLKGSNLVARASGRDAVSGLQWVRKGCFTGKIDEHVLIMLVCDIFMNNDVYDTPQSAFQGLLRFLALMAEFDWLNTPYVCNFGNLSQESGSGSSNSDSNNSSTNKTMDPIKSVPVAHRYRLYQTRMLNLRGNGDGLYCMFVVVPGFDNESKWTRPRIATCCRCCNRPIFRHARDYLSVFKPPVRKEFHFIVHLKPEFISTNAVLVTSSSTAVTALEKLRKKQKRKGKKKEKEKEKENGENVPSKSSLENNTGEVVNKTLKRSLEDVTTSTNESNKKQKITSTGNNRAVRDLDTQDAYVAGLDILAWLAQEITLRLDGIETYWDQSGGAAIFCKFARERPPQEDALFVAVWELGKGLIDRIELC